MDTPKSLLIEENRRLKERLLAHEKDTFNSGAFIVRMRNQYGEDNLLLLNEIQTIKLQYDFLKEAKEKGNASGEIISIKKQADPSLCNHHSMEMQHYCDHSDRVPYLCNNCGYMEWN